MRRFLLATVAMGPAACAAPLPALQTGPDPADATTPVADTKYTPVTAGTADYRPVDRKSWRDMNDRVAPDPGRMP
jgi:hypothetical protein